MTSELANGIYNIPAKGGMGILGVQVVDGMGRAVWSGADGWSPKFLDRTPSKPAPISAEQAKALAGFGLANDQRFVEIISA